MSWSLPAARFLPPAATLLTLLGGLSVNAAQRHLIAREGTAACVVVVAEDSTEAEKHAARELAGFLGRATGGRFEVLGDYNGDKTRLLVGPPAARVAAPELDIGPLGPDGIVLRSVGRHLIIAGGRPRGTLNAVYTFLEDYVGCRWWSKDAEHIPRRPTLELGPLDRTYAPRLTTRRPMWGDATREWMARNKCHVPTSFGLVHSFIAFSKHPDFDKHPEWFSQIDGRRVRERSQLCLTNDAMTRSFIKSVRWSLAHQTKSVPSAVWVSQNDWGNYCQCEPCRALEEAEGSPSGPIIAFVNKVAADLEQDYPEMDVWTLAYDYSQAPPKTLKPRDNVVVWLCTTGCEYSRPLTDDVNNTFRDRLEKWAQVTDRVYIWDYLVNFGHYLIPHPNLRALGPNARLLAAHAEGIRGQGGWDTEGAELAELRMWVLAKLYWDPDLEAEALIDEFLAGFYGSAAGVLRRYIDFVHDTALTEGIHLGMTSPPVFEFLSFENLCRACGLLREALQAADSEDIRRRIRRLQLGLDYLFLVRWDEFWYTAQAKGMPWPIEESLDEVYHRFLATKKATGVRRISEQDARDWFKTVIPKIGRPRTSPPPGCETLQPDQWVDLNDSGLRLNHSSAKPVIVDDPAASDGKAARIAGDTAHWIDWPVGSLPLVALSQGQRLRVRASVRCDFSEGAETAFVYGLALAAVKEEQAVDFGTESLVSGRFQTVDLGLHQIRPGWANIWFKSSGDPRVKSVLIDRIWLIKEEAGGDQP